MSMLLKVTMEKYQCQMKRVIYGISYNGHLLHDEASVIPRLVHTNSIVLMILSALKNTCTQDEKAFFGKTRDKEILSERSSLAFLTNRVNARRKLTNA